LDERLQTVIAKLVCRECGRSVERTLNLQPDVATPREFVCAVCMGERSITDGMTDEEIATCSAPLNDGDVARRRVAIQERKNKRSVDWPRLKPTAEQARQMFRADRWPVPGTTREERSANRLRMLEAFMADVERRGWKCWDCGCDLDFKTLCAVRLPGKILPGCRRCVGRQSAMRRWQRKKGGVEKNQPRWVPRPDYTY
jgi:hypothetical protein